MKYLGFILSILLACPTGARAKETEHTYLGVYCHTQESAQHIAYRLMSDFLNVERANRRARISLAILGSFQKKIIIVDLSSSTSFRRVPECVCAQKKVRAEIQNTLYEVNERGSIMRVHEYLTDNHHDVLPIRRPYFYVGGSHSICIPEPPDAVHARMR